MSSAQATQNKAGKKKKQSAMSLGEFYAQVDTGSGGGNAAAGGTKSWADEMNSLDTDKPALDLNEIRSQLPTAPKAALAPDINLDLVPKNPPFTAHLSNVSYEADDSKIRAFFLDSKILNVRLPQDERGRFRGFGQVDFEDRESLINALDKNETKFFNRPIKVQLESVYKQQRERAHGGGFHGSSSGAAGESNSDDIDWRARPAPEQESSEQLPSRQYSQTFMNRQQRNPDFQGGQQQQQRRWQNRQGGEGEQQSERRQGGYQRGEGYQRNEGGYQRNEGGYQRNEGSYQRNEGGYQRNEGGFQRQGGYNRPSGGGYNRPQQDQFEFEQRPHHQQQPAAENVEGAPSSATTELKERPKIMLQPRTLPPKELEGDALAAASGIFGSAKPVNTAAKEREIEEKIAKEREALALAQQQQKENEEKEQEAPKPPAQPAHERSHKTSFNSDDGRKHHNKSQESEFTTVGGKRQNKNDHQQSRNDNSNQRLSQSSSFTSPPSGNRQYTGGHQNRSGGSSSGGGDSAGHRQQQPSQNAWARSSGGKTTADLFTSNNSQESEQTTTSTTTHQAPFTKPNTNNPNRTYTNSKYQNRPQSNRDNNNRDMNRRFNDKNTNKIAGGRGGGRGGARNETTSRGPGGASGGGGGGSGFSGGNTNSSNAFNPPVAEVKESGPGKIENKFAALTVDDDGDGDYYGEEDYEDDQQQHHEEDVAAN